MKKYIVTLVLIVGYYDNEYNEPRLRFNEITIEADTELNAIKQAKDLDQTGFSVWESYCEEI